MAYNKIIYGGQTLIDLSADTVTADKLSKGYTAHDRNGDTIIGTNEGGGGSNTPNGLFRSASAMGVIIRTYSAETTTIMPYRYSAINTSVSGEIK